MKTITALTIAALAEASGELVAGSWRLSTCLLLRLLLIPIVVGEV